MLFKMIKTKAIKFEDNVDTDQIIGAEYLTLATVDDMVKHTFENYKHFRDDYLVGDIVVGGHNFGCGSSREQAPAVLKQGGAGAVIAKDFARIFYRSAINLGLLVLECDETDRIFHLDLLEVDFSAGRIRNVTRQEEYPTKPLPQFIKDILDAGGIINYMAQKKK